MTCSPRRVAAAPGWAAAHFEQGKYWLRRDDMPAAAEAFGRASQLMPTFASAAANWGATLGELDRPDEALAAFTRALASDPTNAQAREQRRRRAARAGTARPTRRRPSAA